MKNNSNRKLIILFIILLIMVIIFALISNSSDKKKEQRLYNKLNEVGSKFYEEFYYDTITDDLLLRYEKNGIKINLESLESYDFLNEYFHPNIFINPKTKEDCNKKDTVVIIYPHSPYEKKDYKIKTFLECGF